MKTDTAPITLGKFIKKKKILNALSSTLPTFPKAKPESHKHLAAIKKTGMLPILIPLSLFTRTNKRLQICSQVLYLHLEKLKKIIQAGSSFSLLEPFVSF